MMKDNSQLKLSLFFVDQYQKNRYNNLVPDCLFPYSYSGGYTLGYYFFMFALG